MRLRTILLLVLAFYVVHVVCSVSVVQVVEQTGTKLLQQVLTGSATLILKHGALSFLERAEVRVLEEMIRHMEYEKMQDEIKNKLLKAGLMMNATFDVYTRKYDCDVGSNYIQLTFKFGVPTIPDPDKWILKFFS